MSFIPFFISFTAYNEVEILFGSYFSVGLLALIMSVFGF